MQSTRLQYSLQQYFLVIGLLLFRIVHLTMLFHLTLLSMYITSKWWKHSKTMTSRSSVCVVVFGHQVGQSGSRAAGVRVMGVSY